MKHSKHICSILLLISLLSGLLISPKAFSQQEPQYTQYMHNILTVNPAYAGTGDALNMVLLSRMQWTGLDGAPQTHNFSLHTPIRKYKMGLGFSIVSDDYGPVNNLFLNVDYAYHVNIMPKTILSMGLNGGLYNYHIGLSSLNTENPDPAFAQDIDQKFIPNAGVGLYLYSPKFFAGASFPRLFQTALDEEQDRESAFTLQRHFFFMAGYNIDIAPQLIIKPSLITRITEGAPFSADFTARFVFQNTYTVGLSYRTDDSFAAMAGLQLNKQLMVGYAYDISQKELNSFSNGSHELVIHFNLVKTPKEKVVSPRNF